MSLLELTLQRRPSFREATIGEVTYANGHLCWTLEDQIRPPGVKIPGRTAIPAGRYQIYRTYSPNFKCFLPIILGVPDFTGIRVHWGNVAAHTDGCVLVGTTVDSATSIGGSVAAFHLFDSVIVQALAEERQIWINILNPK